VAKCVGLQWLNVWTFSGEMCGEPIVAKCVGL
jgi:hypothetical protein